MYYMPLSYELLRISYDKSIVCFISYDKGTKNYKSIRGIPNLCSHKQSILFSGGFKGITPDKCSQGPTFL